MSAKAVEAVFFWAYTKTPFVGVYTLRSGTIFNKDYLQSPEGQYETIDEVLRWAGGGEVSVEYRWPGGSSPGFWRHAGDGRGQLGWLMQNSPLPWRLGDPNTDPIATFAGDPGKGDPTSAEGEFAKLNARNEGPYIVAVKLYGEDRILHTRAYLATPPQGLEHRGVDRLPKALREALLAKSSSGGALKLTEYRTPRAAKLLSRVIAALDKDPNVLLIGPPGTGKTVILEELREHYERTEPQILFDPDVMDDAWTEVMPPASESKVVSLVFHPSYTYENFVAGLMPKGGGGLELVAKPGPLVSLAHWARGSDRAALLIADEFNRGAAAAIFGDTLGLLDRDKRDRPGSPGAWIERPFMGDEMQVAPEFAAEGDRRDVAARFSLPENLRLVAAMNSTDRSVAPIDAALRRRFAIINVGPDYEALAEHFGVPVPATVFVPPVSWTPDDVRELAIRLLMSVNERVLEVLGQDFLLGHALLWHVSGSDIETVASSLVHAFDERIVATLRLTFADQDEALGAVLGIAPDSGDRDRIGYWRKPTGAMAAIANRRLVLNDLSSWDDVERQLQALSSIVTA